MESKIKHNGLVTITGASSGIGAATAKRLSKLGHPLLLIARRLDKLKELNLPNTIYAQVDITNSENFKNAIRNAEKKYGQTDCLINNAGVMLLGQVDTQNPEEFSRMLDLNVNAVLNGMHFVLPEMKKRKQGTIINISSVAGLKTQRNRAAYGGTKFAVQALSEIVREEAAEFNVRVITIAPGVVETELLSHTSSEEIKNKYYDWKKKIGKVLDPDDIAKTIEFAYKMPQDICIRNLVVAATKQET